MKVAANDNIPMIDPLMRLQDVMAATQLGSSTIYRKMAARQFPRPLRLGPGSVRWRSSEVRAWIDALQRAA